MSESKVTPLVVAQQVEAGREFYRRKLALGHAVSLAEAEVRSGGDTSADKIVAIAQRFERYLKGGEN